MPIEAGRRGRTRPLAIPGDRFLRTRTFRSQPFLARTPAVIGITKDSSGAPLGGCTVHLFLTDADLEIDQTVSDAATGAFALFATVSGTLYIVAYKPGGPDVFGTTENTLVAE